MANTKPDTHSELGRPCMLAIAGLDPSGGAGLAADLRSAHVAGVWGCAVCAVLTVQSTAGLVAAHAVEPSLVRAQAHEVLAHQHVASIKTGALGSAENVEVVEQLVRSFEGVCVVDPVMIATRADSGARLLSVRGLEAMRRLVSVATVVTPNVDEAEALLDRSISCERDLVDASLGLVRLGARCALVKGGHLQGEESVDMLAIGDRIVRLAAPRLNVPEFHGGGCTLASLIASKMAFARARADNDDAIEDACVWAKQRLVHAIASAQQIGDGLRVLEVQRAQVGSGET